MGLNRLWSEIWTLDNALHTVLGCALMGLFAGGSLSSGWVEAAIQATGILYFREVTQVQCRNKWLRYYETTDTKGMDFTEGWLLDLHHNMEWIVPGVLTIGAGWAIDLNIN